MTVPEGIHPTAVIDPHRNGPPETLFGLKVRRALALGSHIWAGLDEVLGPFGEGGVTKQRRQMRAIRPQDLHPLVAPVRHDDVSVTIDADSRRPTKLAILCAR